MRNVFDVDVFRMPRFKRRFCWEEEPLMSKDRDKWLADIVKAVANQMTKKRAVLIICENIIWAEKIHTKLQEAAIPVPLSIEADANGEKEQKCSQAKISLYVSSFDDEFQKRQHETSLAPGDVIVATNLAGRGTDFKIGAQLASNGGMHVIIGYVPPNARVEDQAQGRTARAGQLGSFQFVVCQRSVRTDEDGCDELDRLKGSRDAAESRRLEQIRTQGLQRIYLEEKLFDRFRMEVYEPIKSIMSPNNNSCNDNDSNDSPPTEYPMGAVDKLELDFLTNQWAFWLDENAQLFRKAHSKEAQQVEANFEQFKTDCLSKCRDWKPTEKEGLLQKATNYVGSFFQSQDEADNVVARYATMPSELLKLGQAYEDVCKPDAALRCYQSILKEEPLHEAALLFTARAQLNKADLDQKIKVKPILFAAQEAIRKKVELYSAANQMVSRTTDCQLALAANNTFSGQISDAISLLKVHESTMGQILGQSMQQTLAANYANQKEAEEVVRVVFQLLKDKDFLKSSRLSRKVGFDLTANELTVLSKKTGIEAQQTTRKIEWPSVLLYCRESCIEFIRKKLANCQRGFDRDDLTGIVACRHDLWQLLVDQGYVVDEKTTVGWFLQPQSVDKRKAKRKQKEKSDPNSNQNQNPDVDANQDEFEEFEEETEKPMRLKTFKDILAVQVLTDWLERHYGHEFDQVVSVLDLNAESQEKLKNKLQDEGYLVQLDRRTGRLAKPIDPQSLPDSLKRFKVILEAWQQVLQEKLKRNKFETDKSERKKSMKKIEKSIKEKKIEKTDSLVQDAIAVDEAKCLQIVREDLPLPDDRQQAVDQLFNFLVSNGVVNEPSLIFTRQHCQSKDTVSQRSQEIAELIKASTAIRRIFERHNQPPPPIETVTIGDVISYVKSNPLKSFGNASLLPLVSSFSLVKYDANILKDFIQSNKSDIQQWLAEQQREEEYKVYLQRINSALLASVGQLKTIAVVSAKFNQLADYFISNQERTFPSEEMETFRSKSQDQVIALEKPWLLDWRALAVVALGLIQIGVGVALTACTFGGAAFIGGALIQEGVSDMIFGVQSTISGEFSLSAYGSHKMWSVGMTALTCGVGAYFSQGAAVGRAATYAYKGKAGLALMIAMGKAVLKHCAKALASVASSIIVEKFLTWFKKFIYEGILKHIKSAVSWCLSSMFNKLSQWLDQLRQFLKTKGMTASQIEAHIRATLGRAKTTPMRTAWISQVTSKASSVAGALGGGFSQAGGLFEVQSDVQKNMAHTLLTVDKNVDAGMTSFNDSSNSQNMAAKLASWAKKANNLLKLLKHGEAVASLVSHAPIYMQNVNKSFEQETRRVDIENQRQTNQKESKMVVLSDPTFSDDQDSDYSDYSDDSEDSEDSDDDLSTPMMDVRRPVQRTSKRGQTDEESDQETDEETEWLNLKQSMQEELEGDVIKLMLDKVTSTWLQPFLQAQVEGAIRSLGEKAIDMIAGQFSGKKKTDQQQSSPNESKEKDKNNKNNSKEMENLKKTAGEGAVETVTDSNGNPVHQPRDLAQMIQQIGTGEPAGLLEMQMLADFLGTPLAMEGDEGFTIWPNGDKNNANSAFKLQYTKNEDGSNHVSLIGSDGQTIDVQSDPSAPPNRCLYEAIAKAKGCSVDQLLDDFKQHAATNKRAQFFFDNKLQDALPELSVGRQEGNKADLFFQMDQGKVHRLVATLTSANLKGGTKVNQSHANKFESENDESLNLGHILMKAYGGSGAMKDNNIVLMDKDINQQVYKDMETTLLNFIKENPDVKVHVNVVLNEGVADGKFHHPTNIRFMWATDDNKTFFVSPLIENTPDYARNYIEAKNNNQIQTSTIIAGDRQIQSVHIGDPNPNIVQEFQQLRIDSVTRLPTNHPEMDRPSSIDNGNQPVGPVYFPASQVNWGEKSQQRPVKYDNLDRINTTQTPGDPPLIVTSTSVIPPTIPINERELEREREGEQQQQQRRRQQQ